MNLSIIGGQLQYPRLKSSLDQKEYDIGKAFIWMDMLKSRHRPTKWLKPNRRGTKVDFEFIATNEGLQVAQDEFEVFLEQINRKHGTDFELTRA
ncbi:hypothetical protein ACFQ5D_18095 [Paenibacillus farraposensis]|uniref:Uncharacterized protein n=1 Tax=Paenibacillus farraposensis TaxID=2807095 RepID=A0ABW4DJ19_9BACL|nr:hypothetical protein [Paenibacillus farraposensis]MCC3381942.1 hypothetical protein [Paenibacillus farraposensis]